MDKEVVLSVIDYIVFGFSLFVSVAIGAYFAYTDRNEKSADNYFNGKGQMSPIPVALSLAVSFVSAVTVLGFPVEVYLYGTVWFWIILCFPLVVLTTSNYFIPIYHNLKMKCVYEYLELRFNKSVRILGSLFGLLYLLMYLPTVVYYPSLALSTVTPISTNWAIAITVVVCGLYTVIGGFKSVIWTDAFQSFVMLGGCIALLVNLVVRQDRREVSRIIEDGNRGTWNEFSANPFLRCTAWSVFILGYTDWISLMTTSQPYVQRYTSCVSSSKAKISLYISAFPQTSITLLALLMGLFLYVRYAGCDPYKNGEIGSSDQILPFAIVQNTGNMPGISGLFIATIYSSTFSTISSGINSMIVVIMEDFVSLKWKFRNDGDKLLYSKLLGVVISVSLLILSYLITLLDSTVLQISYTLTSAFGSALFGLFLLGIFAPWVNPIGAIIGSGCGFAVSLWLSIGSLLISTRSQELELSTKNCPTNFTSTTMVSSLPTSSIGSLDLTQDANSVYGISFMYYRLISVVIIIPVGIIASFIAGAEDPRNANPRLFMPLLRSKMFPKKLVSFMRFGVPLINKSDDRKEELEELNKC